MNVPSKESHVPIPFWKWLLMLLFIPYGLYYLVFQSKLKWFVKIPVTFVLLLLSILSLDQALHPYRVEEKLVKETMTHYLAQHSNERMGNLREMDREGAFVWKKDTHIVYRTLTTNGLYDVIVVESGKGEYSVNGVFQVYPTSLWMNEKSKDIYPTAPMAMLYFYKHQKELGALKNVFEKNGTYDLETTKGIYRYSFKKDKVVSVEKKTGEIILQQKNEYTMPEDAVNYFEKHQKDLGKVLEVYGYDMDTEKEMYYVKTTQDIYRVDDYGNGNIKLLKMNETAKPQAN